MDREKSRPSRSRASAQGWITERGLSGYEYLSGTRRRLVPQRSDGPNLSVTKRRTPRGRPSSRAARPGSPCGRRSPCRRGWRAAHEHQHPDSPLAVPKRVAARPDGVADRSGLVLQAAGHQAAGHGRLAAGLAVETTRQRVLQMSFARVQLGVGPLRCRWRPAFPSARGCAAKRSAERWGWGRGPFPSRLGI